MVASVASGAQEDVALRFEAYVGELQGLFTCRGLSFGSPVDLSRLAERLATPGPLQDDLAALVRAIVFREQEDVTQAQLLELLTVAIGGAQVDLSAREFQAPVRQLLAFLGGVLRSLWTRFPEEPQRARVGAVPVQTAPVAAAKRAEVGPQVSSRVRVFEEVVAVPDADWTPLVVPAPDRAEAPNPTVGFRAEAPDPVPNAVPEQPEEGRFPEYRSSGLFTAQRRPLWIVGVCSLCLGLAMGMHLHERAGAAVPPAPGGTQTFHPWFPPVPKADADTVEPSQADAATLHALPKPSPYLGYPADDTPPGRQDADTFTLPEDRVLRRSAPVKERSVPRNVAETGSPTSLAARRPMEATAPPLIPAVPATAVPATAVPLYPHESVFLSSSGAMTANLLSSPAPAYPKAASAAGVEGRVVVQAVIGLDGTVIASRIVSGPPSLQEAALDAVRRWRYRPYLRNGEPTIVATDAVLTFQLAP